MENVATVHVGTSGWHYVHWVGRYYPPALPERQWLAHYLNDFDTVELNNSFYHLPLQSTFEGWHNSVPDHFLFAVKANRFITHRKKLMDPKDSIQAFFERIAALQENLGPILFQLPPRWYVNEERLEAFLLALPQGYRYAFEFRDETWFTPVVRSQLERHNAANCLYQIAGRVSPDWVTADFVYVRLHGPTSHAYQGSYTDQQLYEWADRIRGWLGEGRDVFVYFDNDDSAFAVFNARRLRQMLNS